LHGVLPDRYSLAVKAPFPVSGDQKLIQIVDAALADATRRSKGWLVCKKGCTQCCMGVFAINQLDAVRLQRGLKELANREPARAAAVRSRAQEAVKRLSREFPGDPTTGLLGKNKRERQRFESFANEEPCPALDPAEGTCDLYESRPMTCRTFGPPVRAQGGGLGVCELCYQACSEEEIVGCEMVPDPDDLESVLLRGLEKSSGKRGDTIVAFALAAA
jgi:Fe-S-cluster containining protein